MCRSLVINCVWWSGHLAYYLTVDVLHAQQKLSIMISERILCVTTSSSRVIISKATHTKIIK